LDYVEKVVFRQENGDRPNISNVVVLFTDGASSDLVEDTAERLRNNSASVRKITPDAYTGREFGYEFRLTPAAKIHLKFLEM